jgi:hypothetical protein
MASGRFFGSAYDGVDDGVFADGEGTLADAVENRSGLVDRVRPLPIQSIMGVLVILRQECARKLASRKFRASPLLA